MNPRRSLLAGVIWLVVALAVVFSVGATIWVGSIARESVIAQHMRRLSLETDQLSFALTQALAERLSAIQVTETLLRSTSGGMSDQALREIFAELKAAYPQLDWIGLARSDGTIIENELGVRTAEIGTAPAWMSGGLRGLWIGIAEDRQSKQVPILPGTYLGDMSAPVHDGSGQVIGVICARLSWRRSRNHPPRLTDETDGFSNATAYVLDRSGVVVVGPSELVGQRWPATLGNRLIDFGAEPADIPQLEKMPNGAELLVARELVGSSPADPTSSWIVQLSETRDRAYLRANTVSLRILSASSLLAAITAAIGLIGARQLTRRLRKLTESVSNTRQSDSGLIDEPRGRDEVAQLGVAFADIIGELHRERRELEQRVIIRTREVERLADDARYAAVVRERLNLARELHDTLAHSMMAVLSVIRYMRRLPPHDSLSIAKELVRAEEVAHEGLQEARRAITQMRINTGVRDTGLGKALMREVEHLTNRTGIGADVSVAPDAAAFADERAETILRMAQEALRNIERHSQATRIVVELRVVEDSTLSLKIEDNGIGFDLAVDNPGHFGIVGLREQAMLIGAELNLNSGANGGTRLTIEVPLAPVAFGS